MAAVYDAALVQQVQAYIDDRSKGPITRFKEICVVLAEAKVSYTLPGVKATKILPHPLNRGGLGINPYDVHRNGKRLKTVGGDRRQLHGAFAFEFAPHGSSMREAQITFNAKIIDNADGLLAPITGEERFLSVGCGHTAAFCRAALHGCVTSEPELADNSNHIDIVKLVVDKEIAGMLHEGWSWTISPHACDTT